MITEYSSSLARFLSPHAERTAEPRADREPEKRDSLPVKVEDWIRADSNRVAAQLDAREFTPDARATHEAVEALARRDNASGDMTRGRGFVGVREDGTKAEGASTWEYRPPVYCADDPDPNGRMLDPILMNGRVRYQPAPPVHVKGAVPGSARDVKRAQLAISEARAERINLSGQLRAVADGLDMRPGVLAKVLGMTPARLARKKPRGR